MRIASAMLVVAVITTFTVLSLGRPKTVIAAVRSLESHDSRAREDSMEQKIISKVREGLEALKTGDLERFGNLTADEAVFLDAHGPAGKAQVLKNAAGFTLTDYSMEDVRFVPISANTGLVVYKLTEKGVSHDKPFGGTGLRVLDLDGPRK